MKNTIGHGERVKGTRELLTSYNSKIRRHLLNNDNNKMLRKSVFISNIFYLKTQGTQMSAGELGAEPRRQLLRLTLHCQEIRT